MNLLTDTPPNQTQEQIVEAIVNSINHISSRTYKDLINIQRTGINIIWNNSKATAQEIIDGLGENALPAFQFHGALTDLLVTISESANIDYTPALPTNAFTVDNQGNITVTDDPYIP